VESKRILAVEGLSIPKGGLVSNPGEAEEKASELGCPVYVKAQVPIHRRSALGGVKLAATPAEARRVASSMLGMRLGGWDVERLLVEEAVKGDGQVFIAFAYSDALKQPLLLASLRGGASVEEGPSIAKEIRPSRGLQPFQARQVSSRLGLRGKRTIALSEFLIRAWSVFRDYDATLLEVNPLTFTPHSGVVALDVHMQLDDDALESNEALRKLQLPSRPELGHPPTPFELRASEIDRTDYRGVAGRVLEFSGDLGLLIGGGGASLTIFDAIRRHGGNPANYCEIGGNPTVRKTAELTKLILTKPGVQKLAVITNVLNNTRVDLLVRGVLKGMMELRIDPGKYPVLFRVPGSWEEEARLILEAYGLHLLGRETSLEDAARLAVEDLGR